MPKNKDLKRLVRSRMDKTGESYTSARSQIPHKTVKSVVPVAKYAACAGMSDDAVRNKTGKDWKGWVQALDSLGAATMKHPEIARLLHQEFDVTSWWAQTVTVGYERIKGLRETGQRRGGQYEINKSKTVPIPITTLYRAFADSRLRRKWLGDVDITVKKNNVNKSVRWLWEDGTPVEVYFWEKGPEKAQAQLQHRELSSKSAADKVRAEWGERFDALATWSKER